MFYFNHLNKLILRVTLDLVLSKILYLKFVNKMLYISSSIWSIWPEIKQFYDTILDHTSWTVCKGTFINFWNDKWCCTTSLTNIAGLSDGASTPDTVSQFWIGRDLNIPFSLQQMPLLFNQIKVTNE